MDNIYELTQEEIETILALIQNYMQKIREIVFNFMKTLNNSTEEIAYG